MNQAVAIEAAQFTEQQLNKWAFVYTLNVAVQNNSTLPAELTIGNDADFHIISMTGSAYGPTDENGIPLLNQNTSFPIAGTAVPSGAGLRAYADRGLLVKITDAGSNRELSSGFAPVETLFTPGYGLGMTIPQPFRYYALRNSTLRFDIRNRDVAVDVGEEVPLFHFFSIALYGFKYSVR